MSSTKQEDDIEQSNKIILCTKATNANSKYMQTRNIYLAH